MTDTWLPHSCVGLASWLEDSNIPVEYGSRFREYYIRISDTEQVVMEYCPLCGARFPTSLRDEWFERIWAAGLDGPEDIRIPETMRTDEWWRVDGL